MNEKNQANWDELEPERTINDCSFKAHAFESF